jgi:ADP-ribose pyrophosphatase YjhB (NUDIX family)
MRRQACAGALVYDGDGRLLLVRRGHAPALGTWCEPSGRCRPGESPADAAVRECAEETGLAVRPVREAGTVSVDGGNGVVYDITDFVCELLGGTARAGDDAAELRWVSAAELDELELAPGLRDALTAWGCRPR